jgi:hypothetical protein
MRVQHKGKTPPQKGRKSTLSLRLGAAVLLFLAVLGAKNWLPQAEPAMSVLGRTLSSNTDLSAVTRLVGQAAEDGQWQQVFSYLFLWEEDSSKSLPRSHRQAENTFLSTSSPQEQLTHYLPETPEKASWLTWET